MPNTVPAGHATEKSQMLMYRVLQVIARPSLYLLPFRMWVTRLWVTHVQKRFVFDS